MPQLPSCFDRADGVDERPGTPSDAGQFKVQVPGNPNANITNVTLEEEASSPEIERAEQATIVHRFRTSWEDALTRLETLGRGRVLEDSEGRLTKILSSRVVREQPGTALLTITEEGMSFDSPPDQFQITAVELGVNIMKHPRYFYAFLGDGAGSATELKNQSVIRLLQSFFENPTVGFRDALTDMLKSSIGTEAGTGEQPPAASANGTSYTFSGLVSGTDLAKRAALEIIQKFWRGEETPYVIGYEVKWTRFYFRPPYINPGGYIEDPITDAAPQLPDYLYSPSYPPDPSLSIFQLLDWYNPQCYSLTGEPGGGVSISWLRKSDILSWERTWFRLERTWIGSPVGHWDEQLYTTASRPAVPDDYLLTQTNT